MKKLLYLSFFALTCGSVFADESTINKKNNCDEDVKKSIEFELEEKCACSKRRKDRAKQDEQITEELIVKYLEDIELEEKCACSQPKKERTKEEKEVEELLVKYLEVSSDETEDKCACSSSKKKK